MLQQQELEGNALWVGGEALMRLAEVVFNQELWENLLAVPHFFRCFSRAEDTVDTEATKHYILGTVSRCGETCTMKTQ